MGARGRSGVSPSIAWGPLVMRLRAWSRMDTSTSRRTWPGHAWRCSTRVCRRTRIRSAIRCSWRALCTRSARSAGYRVGSVTTPGWTLRSTTPLFRATTAPLLRGACSARSKRNSVSRVSCPEMPAGSASASSKEVRGPAHSSPCSGSLVRCVARATFFVLKEGVSSFLSPGSRVWMGAQGVCEFRCDHHPKIGEACGADARCDPLAFCGAGGRFEVRIGP